MAGTVKLPDSISKLMAGANKKADEGPSQILGKDDFLKLLMTELKYQDPTTAKQDKEFIAQLAQFSSLEQTTKLADSLGAQAAFTQLSQASTLVGKQVEVNDFTNGRNVTGVVDEVRMVDGKAQVHVGGHAYPVSAILGVKEPQSATAAPAGATAAAPAAPAAAPPAAATQGNGSQAQG